MSVYKVAGGHNIAEVSLATVSPQPRSEGGIQYTTRTYAANGSVYQEGPYIELTWDVFISDTVYRATLHQFGVRDNNRAMVTVMIPNGVRTWGRYNGYAVQPEAGKEMRYQGRRVKGVTLLVRDLEAAT